MDLTIETAHDLIRIINAYPQWRKQVRESLFPEIDLPKAFQELADAQRRTEQSIRELSQAQRRTEQTVRELSQTVKEMASDIRKLQVVVKHDTTRLARIDKKMVEAGQERQAIRDDLEVVRRGQEDLRRGQDELKRNQNDLRGQSYEQKIRDRADTIFGYFLRRGRKMRNEIAEILLEAEEKGQISEQEHEHVLASDLLWGGKLKSSKEELFLVVEVSWLAEEHDLEGAYNRANILRSIGFESLPVVAAIHWTTELSKEALDLGIVIVTDMRLDKASWQAALAPMV